MAPDALPFRTKVTLPDERTLPIGKLLCIGRNYAEHASEMQSNVPDEPMVFLKPASAVVRDGAEVRLPPHSNDVHHEVELVAVIGRGGRDIPEADALNHVAAYAVGLDMTARDLQAAAKERRHPWSVAKGFDTFAPLGPLTPADEVGDPQQLVLELKVNGETRQKARTDRMIFPVATLVHYCSQIFTLQPGDLLYTGTPSGVGAVAEGDELEATATRCAPLRVRVGRRA
jgi:2-keto-4-pentenoate hydratase/2-oxohepta-3-ene-1,7-dioic acid hydratase in catechol pathway